MDAQNLGRRGGRYQGETGLCARWMEFITLVVFQNPEKQRLGNAEENRGREERVYVYDWSGHVVYIGPDTKLTRQFLGQIKIFFGVIAIVFLSISEGRERKRELKEPDVRVIRRVLHATHWRNILASAFVGVC
jgi:hypothetical protein